MPEAPTWDFVADAASKITDKSAGVYGICLRGKAGWGENMAFLTAMANSFGARWFDEKWQPQFDSPEWKNDADHLCQPDEGRRPAGRVLQRLQREPRAVQRRQVRHVDRRDGCRLLRHQSEGVQGRRQGRLRAGAEQRPGQERATGSGPGPSPFPPARRRSRRPRSSSPGRPARTTPSSSPPRKAGRNVPPGTRTSLYQNPEYQKAAPFAKLTLELDQLGRPEPARRSSRCPMSACSSPPSRSSRASAPPSASSSPRRLPGTSTVDAALTAAQSQTEREMKRAGYIK